MGEVTITINGRPYRMACEDGQEAHLERLGKDLSARVDDLAGQIGQVGDAQLLVMAGLIAADDAMQAGDGAGETDAEAEALREEVAQLQDANATLERRIAETAGAATAQVRLEAEVDDLKAKLAEAREDAASNGGDAEAAAELEQLRAEIAGLKQAAEAAAAGDADAAAEVAALKRAADDRAAEEAEAAAAIEALAGRVARLAETLRS